MADKPKVFISSTIYDFRDLRSALKFWLEELGYEVLLSDHNDFPVRADLSSYDTCLEAVDDCDYFIVLVGSRVGGWYDAENRISITQAEYRRAYQVLTEGRIKIVAFVRQDIWDVKEDRKALEHLLKSEASLSTELEEGDVDKITKHPSKFANDAEFTFDFINEITRIEEMKVSLAEGSSFPIGNWVRQFRDFRDITDALRVEFKIGTTLRRVALLANLAAEIEANLRFMMCQYEGQAIPKYNWASEARDSFAGGVDDASEIPGKYLKSLASFAIIGCGFGVNLSTNALNEAVNSGEFLEFDQTADALFVGTMQQRLLDLKRNIERLRRNEEMLDVRTRTAICERFKLFDGDEPERVNNLKMVPIFSVHDGQFNVIELSRAIHRAARGDLSLLNNIRLYGDSPVEGQSEAIRRERPSQDQIRQWLDE